MIQFFSPSYKRANNTYVDKWCKDVTFCVHSFDYDDYSGNKILLSDQSIGNMAKVRNEIIKKAKSEYIVLLDDDVKYIAYIEKGKIIEPTFDEIYNKILEIIEIMEGMNTVLGGINLQSDPKFYREYSPFSFLSPILGPFMIIKKNDLKFDERLGLNEDYDYSLQVLNKYGSIVRNNKRHYVANHITQKGGCGSYRTTTKEIDQSKIMIKKWGNDIVKYNFEKSTNPVISVPIKGI